MIVTLPWPASGLSPNARGHWAIKAKLAKAARRDAYILTREAMNGKAYGPGPIMSRVEFWPPDNRSRDIDNMLASAKSALDGVADAIGVDDSEWEISLKRMCPGAFKGGRVVVAINE